MSRPTRIKLRGLDRFLITILLVMVLASPIIIVFSKSVLSKSNIEVEKMKVKLEKQSSVNESLAMKINELASLSNIQDIAEEFGLSYNNDNIVIIK